VTTNVFTTKIGVLSPSHTVQGPISGNANVGPIGTAVPGNLGLRAVNSTYTDNVSTGSPNLAIHAIGQPTLTATSALTPGNLSTFYIANAPIGGTNVTVTGANTYALFVGAGNSYFGGNVTANYYIGNASQLQAIPAANLSGNVAVANGGTGSTTLTANALIVGNTAGAVTFITPGTSGNILTSNGTNWYSTAFVATSATNAAAVLTNTSVNTTVYITGTSNSANGNFSLEKVTGVFVNMATNTITATTFAGAVAAGANTITTTGNITGGNLLFGSGVVSGTGNITGGNIIGIIAAGSNTITTSGNITGGNLLFGSGVVSGSGNITTTGNITGGNLLFGSGVVSGTGNITGGNIIANGQFLTGLNAANISTGNVAVSAGGTGSTTLTANALLVGNATGAVTFITATGTTGNVLTFNGTNWVSSAVSATASFPLTSGTSNINVSATGGNLLFTANGVANILTVANNASVGQVVVAGTLTSTGNAIVPNLTIGSGSGGNLTGANVISANTFSGNVGAAVANGYVYANSLTAGLGAYGNANISAVTANLGIRALAATFTDNAAAASSTIANAAVHALAIPSLAAANTLVTATNAATFYIAGAPTQGTNMTITNPYSLFVAGGNSFFGGNVTGSNFIGIHANGTSNVAIPTAGGNVNISAGGTANVVVVTTTGVNIAGTLNTGSNTIVTTGNITGGGFSGNGFVASGGGTGQLALSSAAGNIGIRALQATYTDNSVASTNLGLFGVHVIRTPTYAASNTGIVGNAASFIIESAPTQGTNVTFTNSYALYVSGNTNIAGNMFTGNIIANTNSNSYIAANSITAYGSYTGTANTTAISSAPSTGSMGIRALSATYTDNSAAASSTIPSAAIHYLSTPSLAAANTSVTASQAATFYIAGAPTAGTNMTITAGQSYALQVNSGNIYLGGGIVFANAQTISGNNLTITTGSTSNAGNITGNWTVSSGSLLRASDGNASNVLYGNGAFAAAPTGTYNNSSVATYLASFGSNTIVTTGNITGGNIIGTHVGNVTTTGNITTGNLLFGSGVVSGSGNITTTGNITGGNIIGTHVGNVTTTGNITTGNLLFGSGVVSGTGNITGGNLTVSGNAIGVNVPQSGAAKSANYALARTDVGQFIILSTANIQANLTQNTFLPGDIFTIYNSGTGNVFVNALSNVTLYLSGNSTAANRTLAQKSVCTLLCVANALNATTFIISGGGLS